MDELLAKYKRHNRVFWCWWGLCILSILIGFGGLLLESDGMAAGCIQLILTVVSIVGLVATQGKKGAVVRDMAIIFDRTPEDGSTLQQKLISAGIAKRDTMKYRAVKPRSSQDQRKSNPSPASDVCRCPNCGSDNMVKAKSDLMEFFQVLVIFSLLGSVTPFALFAFGACCVLALLTKIVYTLSGISVKKMKCRSCGKEFELTVEWR